MSFQIDFPAQPRFPILAPDGTAAAPSYSFSGYPNKGFYSNAASSIGVTVGGILRLQFYGTGIDILSNTGTLRFGGSQDTILTWDAANTLALRNSTNAQGFRVYNTYTDASNYERFQVDWASEASVCRIGVFNAGTGSKRPVTIEGNGVYIRCLGGSTSTAWSFNNVGHLLATTDNTYDIGASGGPRPRNVYVGSNISAAGGIGVGGDAAISGAHLNIAASTTAAASLRLDTTGVAPTAPTNGDVWFDGTDVKIRVGGVTKTFTLV